MFAKERPLPKALNIVRPSPPLYFSQQDSCSMASSPSEISTISNFSTFSNSRPQPTIFNPASLFQNNLNNFKSSVNTVGVNPHRFLQRPRSNSTVSRSTFFTAFSDYSNVNADDDDDDYDELDSIDGMTDEEEEEEEEEDDEDEEDEEDEEEENIKIVAKVRHGTIMNGKGEFVSKGSKNDHWLDEARTNRKIADLEIENQTLLSLNTTLESKLKQQALQISELEKRLQQVNEPPLTPISDKQVDDEDDQNESVFSFKSIEEDEEESDRIFQRVKLAVEHLIEQAEIALIEKSKQSGKVLQQQDHHLKEDEETLRKLSIRSSSPIEMKKRSTARRVSDTSAIKPSPRPSSVKMTRNLSRQSSPPILQRSVSPSLQRAASPSLQRSTSSLQRAASPSLQRSASPSLQRSTSPSTQQRPSSRLSTHKQDSGKPKWH
ncbi:hypothetical protein G6F16_010532 [Rhizopus arrhizus]|uniref:Uncharacterized protein n=1 Tax=Rhizopus oryzae TaxID=64495 RepID=A0A9P7BLV0_RHIOR|nr:hypothetical protein G6F23_010722 [Rhizopus arrhizus]KAG0780734.1 hypothetical protein G6F22_009928 [Rhizopus arrhizus]KAG0788837.1 hypothetical protein G6F21_006937 [Rhizopus arrhizus]KAG0810664.1 hypothetical protein G6F20_007776 [Rhizopus arrhizus]KAG0823952.1 hypothetical protein G6F19_010585 [Rhizopus arrhizus]